MQGPLEADFEGGHVCTDHLLQRALLRELTRACQLLVVIIMMDVSK